MHFRLLFFVILLALYACGMRAHATAVDSVFATASSDGAIVWADSVTAAADSCCEASAARVAGAERAAGIQASRSTQFRAEQFAFPAAAIALGGAGVKNHLVDTSSERERWTTVDDKIQYVPIGAYVVLGFIPGVRHEHHIGDRFLAGATAYICMTAICQGAKRLVREPRPDTGAPKSFPSGHTATAFCGAELCRLEYGNAYGAAAYAFAATTGIMRVVNNRHWCNDVLAGAGIGFLSAHVGYWLLPWEQRVCRRIFRRGQSGRETVGTPFIVAPSYEYETKAPSLTFAMRF